VLFLALSLRSKAVCFCSARLRWKFPTDIAAATQASAASSGMGRRRKRIFKRVAYDKGRSDTLDCLEKKIPAMRIVVIGFLIAIVASLASALVFLFRDQGRDSKRMVKALALRVGLSIMLFILLAAGYYSGLITDKL
jgi:hypothetical protein